MSVDQTALYGRARRKVIARIGYMPQQLVCPPELRVSDALAYVLDPRRASSTSRRNPELLERVGLTSKASRRVGQLSGGMNRRLALAVALVTNPDVPLLDEPTTGLDPAQRCRAARHRGWPPGSEAATILKSRRQGGRRHDADRVAVLDEGELLYDGGMSTS